MSAHPLRKLLVAILCLFTSASADAAEPPEIIKLQYRIAQDAVSPSSFWAVFPNGMSPGVRINWKLAPEDKKRLDAIIATLERDGPNGKEFTAKGVWKHKGFECDIYDITPNP
jgi:hypothetical protein